MAKIKFTPIHFEELIKKGYSMDQMVLLRWISEGSDLTDLLNSGSAKITALYQSLSRKGLITEDGKSLTGLGKNLMTFLDTEDPPRLPKRKPVEKKVVDSPGFDLWWSSYPGTDTFTHKGIPFEGTRSLRVNKDNCKIKFDKILSEGEYTPSDMIAALNFDVLQKKENSVKLKTNKLTYMQNSLTYLNQYSFEPFIELIKKGVKVAETPKFQRGGTDI